MPEPKIMELRPSHLNRGDWLYLGDNVVIVSGPVDVKAKYSYVPIEGQERPLRLAHDVTQRVSRLVPTEEEAEAARIEREHAWVRTEMFQAATDVEKTRNDLVESLPMKDPTWHGRRWEAYTEAQITARIWENVVEVALNHGVDLVAATKLWAAKLTEEIVRDVKFGSRSSSDMHNLAKALTLQVQAGWVDELRWRVE